MQATHTDTAFDVKITGVAGELLQMARMGKTGESPIQDDLMELNHEYAADHKTLAAIQKQYQAMSKDDPLFINEVQIGRDGSLEFNANKTTTPELEKMQLQFANDLMHRYADKHNKPDLVKADDKALLVEAAAMQKEEKNIVVHKQG